MIWKRCLHKFQNFPEPEGHGWSYKDGDLCKVWMNGSPAPEAVLKLLSCECSRNCTDESCPCVQNGLSCTDMCKRKDCENSHPEVSVEEDGSDSDLDNEEDNYDVDDV